MKLLKVCLNVYRLLIIIDLAELSVDKGNSRSVAESPCFIAPVKRRLTIDSSPIKKVRRKPSKLSRVACSFLDLEAEGEEDYDSNDQEDLDRDLSSFIDDDSEASDHQSDMMGFYRQSIIDRSPITNVDDDLSSNMASEMDDDYLLSKIASEMDDFFL